MEASPIATPARRPGCRPTCRTASAPLPATPQGGPEAARRFSWPLLRELPDRRLCLPAAEVAPEIDQPAIGLVDRQAQEPGGAAQQARIAAARQLELLP